MILNIIIFIIVIGILVLVHELGHFIMAKKIGMSVEEFGVGFPPKIFSFIKNETIYSINLIPLGGFVKIKGETYEVEEEAKKNPKLFYNRPLWTRIIVVLAGVLMNFIFGWLVLSIGFLAGFPSMTRDLSQIKGVQILKQEIVIAQVNKNSSAQKAGLKAGQVMLSSGNTVFKTVYDIQKFSKNHQGQTLTFQIKDEQDQIKNFNIKLADNTDAPLGVILIPDNLVKFKFPQAFWQAGVETYQISAITGNALKDLIGDLFVRGKISENISGPVGIYQATARAADVGATAVVMIAVILSINLALINLVPFPALDGGKLVFLIIEAIFRKRVIAVRLEQTIETFGFFLLILFILAVTYKDIIRIG